MKNNFLKKGFTLIELIIVASIFFIITSIVLLRQARFSSDTLITNAAYEIALFMREAQVFGTGSKIESSGRSSYGLYFTDIDQKNIVMFADLPDSNNKFNHEFDSGIDPEIKRLTLNRQQLIHSFCLVKDIGGPCQPDTFNDVNISFVKPNFNAYIRARSGVGAYQDYAEFKLKIVSSLGDKCRTVSVNSVGQITVDPVEFGVLCSN